MTVIVGGDAHKVPVTYQKGKEHKDSAGEKYNIYEGGTAMSATVTALRDESIEARVKVIACKDGKCLLPSTIKVK